MAGDDPDDAGVPNPFSGIPMFGDLARALAGQGPLNWDVARQFAQMAATNGASEPNVDPAVRFALADLARIAEMHVRDVTGVDLPGAEIVTVTPGGWTQRSLEAYRPLFTELAASLGRRPETDDEADAGGDPFAAMMANLSQLMAPAMLGMAVGSMVGRLGARAFGQYDLPVPRPPSNELLLVPATIDGFAADWSLPLDEMRLWVLVQELAAKALFSAPHVRDSLSDLVRRHVGAFRPDPSAVADQLTEIDIESEDPLRAIQKALGDPAVLLGAVESPEQRALQPALDATLAAVVGYVDHVVDETSRRLIGAEAGRVTEAVRRRRVETSPDDVFVERLLGLKLSRQQVERGRAFTAGVVERAGSSGLAQMIERPDGLPTPAEIDAPGLWLARLEISS